MTTRRFGDQLRELAQSELKRWGGTELSLTHLAFALANRWTEEFRRVFGIDGIERVKAMLKSENFVGAGEPVTKILNKADSPESAISMMKSVLQFEPTPSQSTTRRQQSSKQPRLLTDLIDDRLNQFNKDGSDQLRDELYVLLGALKIAGFEKEYRVRLRRFTDQYKAPSGESRKETSQSNRLSARTAALLHRVEPSAHIYRNEKSKAIAAQLLRQHPPIIVLAGASGSGRTALLAEVAAQLQQIDQELPMWRMSAHSADTKPDASLKVALNDLRTPAVVVIDDFDEIAELDTSQANQGLIAAVSAARFHRFARVILVLHERALGRLRALNSTLSDNLFTVTLEPLSTGQLSEIVTRVGHELAASAELKVGAGLIEASLSPDNHAGTTAHPGLALSRIDAAIGRARLHKSNTVEVKHLTDSEGGATLQVTSRDIAETLKARVRGQDKAIATVASRLALTRVGLDIRPERPNGVFLFAGPTGVGKTELARQIAIAEYGTSDALIRLDMSEYGTYEFAITRLIGVGQGYVGHSEPDRWLTTRVSKQPRSVILLDEIEKAHSSVWNTFLQVFDAGKLTDARGFTADFADTVVIMTSNIGAKEASKRVAGFGETGERSGSERQRAAIKESMPPELINRLDDVVLFQTLTVEAVREIAQVELSEAISRLGSAGWQIDYDEDVVRWLAETGYDPAYGARHLIRNIEREFLTLFATTDSRALRVEVRDNALVVLES